MVTEKKKFTKYQIKTAFEYFNNLFTKPGQTPVYSHFVFLNHEILLPHYLALQQSIYDENNDPQYREFQMKANAIQEKWADKNEKGEIARTDNGNPIVIKNRGEAMKELNALQDQYKDLIARIQNKPAQAKEVYAQTVELDVACLSATQFVNDAPPFIVGEFITGAI